MVNKRIHIINGLPVSSEEFNNYTSWLDELVNSISNDNIDTISIYSDNLPNIRIGY